MFDLNTLKFDEKGLIPAIVVDTNTKQVLTLAYMNRESLEISMREGCTCFWSRSRQELWRKGETSGQCAAGRFHHRRLRRRYAAYRGNTKRPCLPYGQQDLLFLRK